MDKKRKKRRNKNEKFFKSIIKKQIIIQNVISKQTYKQSYSYQRISTPSVNIALANELEMRRILKVYFYMLVL